MRKNTLQEFVEKFKKKFPNKHFDFSDSVYVDMHTKMSVKCDKGHVFEIMPCDLISNHGCPVCGGTKRLTTDEFVKRATEVHNGYFTYERTKYTNANNKLTVTCPIHGDFEVKANNHLQGVNCEKCRREGIKHEITLKSRRDWNTKKLTADEFFQKAKSLWGNTYIFDEKTVYKTTREKIWVKCREHGYFDITPAHLLKGRGCPYCAKNKAKTKEEIIQMIKDKQPYADYDFSQLEYVNLHTNITLKCNKCGTIFSNTPANIIYHNNGCPGCNISQLEQEMKQFLEEKSVEFIPQKKFDWLINKRQMSVDFYIPSYNVAIECQGIQHFKETTFSSEMDVQTCFEETKLRDKVKRHLLAQNGIRLFYYSNFDLNFPYVVYTDKEEMWNDITVFLPEISR